MTAEPQNVVDRIIAELESNTDARKLLLRALLTDDFLSMPVRLERIEADVAGLKDGQAQLEARQARLEAGQARLEAGQQEIRAELSQLGGRVSRLEAGQTRLEAGQQEIRADLASLTNTVTQISGTVSRLDGADYEAQATRIAPRRVRSLLNAQIPEILASAREPQALVGLIVHAEAQGRITEDEGGQLELTDLVIQGENPAGETVYVLAEISLTVQESDVTRARDRAGILGKATGCAVFPVVIGTDVAEGLDTGGATVLLIPQRG